MSPAATVGRRLDRVAGARVTACAASEATRLAACLDIPEAELLSGAADVARVCRGAGAVTWDQQVAAVAADLGTTPEELRRELPDLAREAGHAAA